MRWVWKLLFGRRRCWRCTRTVLRADGALLTVSPRRLVFICRWCLPFAHMMVQRRWAQAVALSPTRTASGDVRHLRPAWDTVGRRLAAHPLRRPRRPLTKEPLCPRPARF